MLIIFMNKNVYYGLLQYLIHPEKGDFPITVGPKMLLFLLNLGDLPDIAIFNLLMKNSPFIVNSLSFF